MTQQVDVEAPAAVAQAEVRPGGSAKAKSWLLAALKGRSPPRLEAESPGRGSSAASSSSGGKPKLVQGSYK